MSASKEQTEYSELLKSGLFFEFYPQLTGDYDKDAEQWAVIYEEIQNTRKAL